MADAFPGLARMSVLDLGGSVAFWRLAPVRPCRLVILNLIPLEPVDGVECRVGDACKLPDDLFAEGFDLAVSNSVIEHVGGHARRAEFAQQVRSVAPRYWVQTPYRYFPVEPHWVFPGQQFLPTPAKAWLSQRWPASHIRSSGPTSAVEDALSVELLGVTEMRHYFPDADVMKERFGGLTKSLVAVRTGRGSS